MRERTILSRVNDFLSQAERLGIIRTIQLRVLARLGVREIRLRVSGLEAPVLCRVQDSDIWEFNQSLGPWSEQFNLGFVPSLIVDAGANVGYASLRFKLLFPGARIIAIEPEIGNIRQFKKNCQRYSNISLVPNALWPRSTRLSMVSSGGSNGFQVIEDENGGVTATSLPELMRTFGIEKIDLLKIDIEGGEVELFEDPGAELWLLCVRAILIETHDSKRPGSSEAVRNRLKDRFSYRGQVNEYELYIAQ